MANKDLIILNEPSWGLDVNDEWPVPLPTLVTLVSCADYKGKANFLPVASALILSYSPLVLGVGIARARFSRNYVRRFSHYLMSDTQQFVVNIPTPALREAIRVAGNTSGREVNKFEVAGLTPAPSLRVLPPYIEECPVNFECVVRHTLRLGSHDFFVGEVVAAHRFKNITLHWVRLPVFYSGTEAIAEDEAPGGSGTVLEGSVLLEREDMDLNVADEAVVRNWAELFPVIPSIISCADRMGRPSLVVSVTTAIINRFPLMIGIVLPICNKLTSKAVANFKETGEFIVNFIDNRLEDVLWQIARSEPSEIAFAFADLDLITGTWVSCPLIDSALVNLECELQYIMIMGDMFFIVGKVVAIHKPRSFAMSSDWKALTARENWFWEAVPRYVIQQEETCG